MWYRFFGLQSGTLWFYSEPYDKTKWYIDDLFRDDFRTANCIAGKGGTHCLVLDRE